MNEEVKKALIASVNTLMGFAQQVGAVAKEQIPLVLQEYVKLGMMNAAFWLFVGILLIITGFVWANRWRVGTISVIEMKKDTSNRRYDEHSINEDRRVTAIAGKFIGIVGGSILSVIQLNELLNIWIAPRVYLINKLKELIK